MALLGGAPHPAVGTTVKQSDTAMPGIADGGESPGVGAVLGWESPTGATDYLGGVTRWCLLQLLAVLLAVASLPRPGLLTRSPVLAGPRRAAVQIRSRIPSPAILCVLRTQ